MIKTSKLFQEVSPLSDKDCFILMERHKTSFSFPVHIHPEYELNFVENAAGAQRIVGDSIEEIGHEDIVLIANPKLEHAWVDHNCTSKNIHEITIQFDKDLFGGNLLNRNQILSIKKLFSHAVHGIAFSQETVQTVSPMIKMLTYENEGFYSFIKFFIILYELSKDRNYRTLSNYVTPHPDGQAESVHASVIKYIQEHYTEPLRLDDVAAHVNMSKTSFSRLIKQHTSRTFIDYLNDIRIAEASRMLIDTSQGVAEIGYNCGFNNLSNFNRIFRKKKGVTPTEFRENYRRNRIIV